MDIILPRMVSRNVRKTQILRLIAESAYATSVEVSDSLNISRHNASTSLKTYYNWGLLSREKMERGAYGYNLTQKGLDRLNWLQSLDDEREE